MGKLFIVFLNHSYYNNYMNPLRIIIFVFIFSLQLNAEPTTTVSVLPFINQTAKPRLDKLAPIITQQLKGKLSEYPELTLQEPAASADTHYTITGEYSGTRGKLTIIARITGPDSTKPSIEQVIGSSRKHLERMVDILAYNIRFTLTAQGGRVNRLKVREGWHASLAILSGITMMGSGIMYAICQDNYNRYNKKENLESIEEFYNRANQNYKASAALAGVGFSLSGITLYLLVKNLVPSNYIHAGSQKPVPGKVTFSASEGTYRLTWNVHF